MSINCLFFVFAQKTEAIIGEWLKPSLLYFRFHERRTKMRINGKVGELIAKVGSTLKKHSPEILLGCGLVGFGTTCVLVAKAAPKAKEKLEELHENLAENDEELSKKDIIFEEMKAVAPIYAPAVVSGVTSIFCILGSYKMVTKRTAVFAAAYELAKNNLRDYKKKVKESLGENKEAKIQAEVDKERVRNNPPSSSEVILDADEILCYDNVTARYFKSTVDRIKRAELAIQKKILSDPFCSWASLNDFYYELDIPPCRIGDDIGWNSVTEIDVRFSSILTEDNIPCLVVDYACEPRFDYRKLH